MSKTFEPNLHTPREDYSKEELNKLASRGMRGDLAEQFRDDSRPDIAWEAEQIAKSYGVYLEFNRAKTGTEKDWIYMIRVGLPAGGPITPDQWAVLDDLAERYAVDPSGTSSLRLTTRQNVQFHWVRKPGVLAVVKELAEKAALFTINGCGDNVRNVTACPLCRDAGLFDAPAWAKKVALYFRLPEEPFLQIFAIDPHYLRRPSEERFAYGPALLNRKFKFGFAAVHRHPESGEIERDNCVEALTNDVGIVPLVSESGLEGFQIHIGGGQGERNNKPSFAALARPFARTTPDRLLSVLDAVVAVHQEWGDRQNRIWARLKYLIHKKGLAWYRREVEARLGTRLEDPDPDLDPGPRRLHHGRHRHNGVASFGAYIENGRIIDGPDGRLKTMVREISAQSGTSLIITPNQDLVFSGISPEDEAGFEDRLRSYGWGTRKGRPYTTLRLQSGACVGRDTCRLAYTDSEKFEPELLDELEARGWGELRESIGITGCERQCFRPSTKTIGLIGSGLNRYQLRLFGDRDARFQGGPLASPSGDKVYLRSIPREKVADVLDAIFRHYKTTARADEDMGTFHRRIGSEALIAFLKEDPATRELMVAPSRLTSPLHTPGVCRGDVSTTKEREQKAQDNA